MSERRSKNDGWIDHDGGACPVDENLRVEVISAKGWSITSEAWALKWRGVTKYRVVGAAA
ncbi:hypothetical protein [Agrobacterium pusense]|uniref:Uncharacterized protein n=1 Tax=Agrobacterium pusense TaxID=648995 RepID=A0AA44EQG9_9HYPH|nr:hypothetical protein [Agrobacterium pusense]NRF12471.1 hypothetical protein [Agrobacterium pusense]NRF23181.1 hypothetical protein [Agrobacterium pusense]